MVSGLAVTWWGHASATVEFGAEQPLRVGLDPLFERRLLHLTRRVPLPPGRATDVDVVLVSHLHSDHLHVPSLRRFPASVPLVVPDGALAAVRGLRELAEAGREVVEVEPGRELDVAGLRVQVLPAHHDGRRLPRGPRASPALGFRFGPADGPGTCWYPGDTGEFDRLTDVGAVDLAVVPIGGWGPSLGEHHLDPDQAVRAAAAVGASATLAVHYGTYWPAGLERVHPASHRHFFVTPPERFHAAAARAGLEHPLTPAVAERVVL